MNTWRYFGYIMKFRPGLFILSCLAWGSHHTLPIITGLVVREFFNTLTNNTAATASLGWLIAALVGVEVARQLVGTFGWWYWATFWYSLETLLRKNMLRWLVQDEGTRALPDSPGEAVSRFRDDVDEVVHYLENWVDVGGLLVYVAISGVIMFSISPAITAIIAVPIIFTLLIAELMGKSIKKYRKDNRIATGRVTDFVGELFNATQAVKVAGAEAQVIDRFRTINEKRRKAALKDSLFTELVRSINGNMVNIIIGIILLMVASSMQAGTFTVGDFALFVAYLSRVTNMMFWLNNIITSHKKVGISFERMNRLMQGTQPQALVESGAIYEKGKFPEVPFITKTASDKLQHLDVRGLTYVYPDTERGIADISFSLERGSFTVITGRIGSGKTTLVKTLLGLLPAQAGDISWNGTKVSDAATLFVPPRSAYTPQVPRLFSDTLRDNIMLGLPPEKANLHSALQMAVLERDIEGLEGRLDAIIGPRGVRLSGGQVQRAAAARMFVREAELLVFDDLSSALDVDTERQLWERVFERQQATCLVVSHRKVALRRTDHIIVLKDGKIIASGNLPDLLDSCEEMRLLWNEEYS